MKKFSLEEYLKNPLRKVVTRKGRTVKRILCTDARGDYPIVALVDCGCYDNALSYTKDGGFNASGETNANDLFFAPEKHEGWVNVYKEFDSNSHYMGRICNSEEEAKKKTDINGIYLATIKIEWEE